MFVLYSVCNVSFLYKEFCYISFYFIFINARCELAPTIISMCGTFFPVFDWNNVYCTVHI